MKQFEVYVVNLDPKIGSEIKKSRPAVIVSPDAMNKYLMTLIVAPLTHSVKGYPSRVPSNFQNQGGEIVLDQILTVDKSRLIKKLGMIDKNSAQAIKDILKTMFG
jgi:mRNA interferase MazF